MDGESCPAVVLATIRESWLDGALAELIGDQRVAGVALVGSLGRGDGDDWSDVDLLVVVHDGSFAEFSDRSRNRLWADAGLLVDARQNAPAAATSAGTLDVRSGLPVGVDWYVYPASIAAWPSDCRVLHDTAELRRVDESFAAFNGRGPRQAGTFKTADEVRLAQLAMVPIAGKYIARRSAAAPAMIEFLGGAAADSVGVAPSAQLHALRAVAGRHSIGAPRQIVAAVDSHLALVESTMT